MHKQNISEHVLSNTLSPAFGQRTRRGFLKACITASILGVLLLLPLSSFAAVPYLSGSYVTPLKQGPIKFNPVKRVIQFGYQGNFVISGKSFPGVLYFIRGTSDIGFAWYYGVTGILAGSAVLTPQPDGSYSGTIQFTDRRGNVTDSGEVSVK